MNGWRTSTLLLVCALVFAMLSGSEMKRDRDAVTAYYRDVYKTQLRLKENELAVKEVERQRATHLLDSAVTAYAKQRARVRIVSDTVQTVRTDTVIREYIVPAEYVEAADSVVTTCTLLRATCDAATEARDSVIAGQKYVITGIEAEMRAQKRGRTLERLGSAAVWFGVGFGVKTLMGLAE